MIFLLKVREAERDEYPELHPMPTARLYRTRISRIMRKRRQSPLNPQIQQAIDNVMTWLSLFIQSGTLITLLVTLGKFAARPNITQNQRLDSLEKWRDTVNSRLADDNSHFNLLDKGNRITQEALLALMSHEINGNDIANLKQAKQKLEKYLIEK